jgi:hypothetical protein
MLHMNTFNHRFCPGKEGTGTFYRFLGKGSVVIKVTLTCCYRFDKNIITADFL